jgi:alpha-amylase
MEGTQSQGSLANAFTREDGSPPFDRRWEIPMTGSGLRLIFTLHNHQPVGNFDGVFEAAYRDAYEPFLDVMEDYADIPFVLHTSGPLLEWLAEERPEYVDRLRAMVAAGRVEILGGGFFEPIMTMIPHRDRVGQIRAYAAYLKEILGARARGAWIPERVWEQTLASSLADAGVEYTVLDDEHFRRAGLTDSELFGYYLTEDDGRLVKIFPGSERLRYLTPFREPHESYEFLRRLADARPGCTVVCADDGEKFGSWPETFEHVYTQGWLRRFCDMIRGNADWIHATTFAEAVDNTLPLGRIYIPDGSYREMTEWALPASQFVALKDAVNRAGDSDAVARLKPFVRAGGFWRNFKVKYPESDEMYTRMLGLSNRLAALDQDAEADREELATARDELYRGQCNCAYWHGSFGGLYLPHLRNAIYLHLIAAHNALDAAEAKAGPRVALDVADFNLDSRQEVCLENDHLVAFVRPACGGHLYEFDVRHAATNILSTLDRRPEPYHAAIVAAAGTSPTPPAFTPERVIFKQAGLDHSLVYDGHPRKALVDHFLPAEVALEDVTNRLDNIERGDFVQGAYLSEVQRSAERVTLRMDRTGRADGHAVRVKKTIEMAAGSAGLEVVYTLDDLPEGVPLHFAIEFNLAGMAGHADDRYYSDAAGNRLGMLDSRLDLREQEGISLSDGWLDLAVVLGWSRPSGLWCVPVETVSQSEGGFERVYQSSAVIPHWVVTGDAARRWEVRIRWAVGPAKTPQVTPRLGLVEASASD